MEEDTKRQRKGAFSSVGSRTNDAVLHTSRPSPALIWIKLAVNWTGDSISLLRSPQDPIPGGLVRKNADFFPNSSPLVLLAVAGKQNSFASSDISSSDFRSVQRLFFWGTKWLLLPWTQRARACCVTRGNSLQKFPELFGGTRGEGCGMLSDKKDHLQKLSMAIW